MIQVIQVVRGTGDGKYADVVDVCEEMARGDYGSAPNALVVMARQSALFRHYRDKLDGKTTNGKQKAVEPGLKTEPATS